MKKKSRSWLDLCRISRRPSSLGGLFWCRRTRRSGGGGNGSVEFWRRWNSSSLGNTVLFQSFQSNTSPPSTLPPRRRRKVLETTTAMNTVFAVFFTQSQVRDAIARVASPARVFRSESTDLPRGISPSLFTFFESTPFSPLSKGPSVGKALNRFSTPKDWERPCAFCFFSASRE